MPKVSKKPPEERIKRLRLSHKRKYFKPADYEEPPKVTPEQVRAALFAVDDIFDFSMVPYVLLGDLAYQLFNGQKMKVTKIKVAVKRQEWTQQGRWLFRQFAPSDTRYYKKGPRFKINKFPVEVVLVDKQCPVIDHPDQVIIYSTVIYLPNPFKLYWRDYKWLR